MCAVTSKAQCHSRSLFISVDTDVVIKAKHEAGDGAHDDNKKKREKEKERGLDSMRLEYVNLAGEREREKELRRPLWWCVRERRV